MRTFHTGGVFTSEPTRQIVAKASGQIQFAANLKIRLYRTPTGSDYLEANIDWLEEKLAPLANDGCYFLLDCPGQAELFTLHGGVKRILNHLSSKLHYRLVAVQLVDAHLCSDPAKYMSALLLSLSTMLHLELPQINALSKFDLAEKYGELSFSPDFYLRAQGLERLAVAMRDSLPPRFRKLTSELCSVVEEYGLVGFTPLAIEDKESVAHIINLADKSNGFAFAGLARSASAGEGAAGPPPELQYSAGLLGDAEDLWSRMQDRYGIGQQGSAEDLVADTVVEAPMGRHQSGAS